MVPAQSVADENKDLREQLDTALGALKKARDREASAAGAIHGQVSHGLHVGWCAPLFVGQACVHV